MSDVRRVSHAPVDTAQIQRRTLRVLVTAQILGGMGVGAGGAVMGLLAFQLSGTAALSGVPATFATIGAATGAYLLARVALARGRSRSLSLGHLIGACGALTAIVAAANDLFLLQIVAATLFGWSNASNFQSRYAATDLAADANRARALSTVVWATTLGAVLGPNLIGVGQTVATAVNLPPLAGSFMFSLSAFLLAATIQFLFMRPDPLHVVQAQLAASPSVTPVPRGIRGPLTLIRTIPQARTGLFGITAAHAVMMGVMVMTPVHMRHHGTTLVIIGITVSLHNFGMWAFSPVIGWMTDRYGRRSTLFLGLGQLAAAAVLLATINPTGQYLFAVGLFFLGSGWSFCLIASSTMLTSAVEPADRPGVQGVGDLAMNLAGALGGTLAGIVLAVAGYAFLAFGALVLLIAPTVSALRLRPDR